MAATRPSAHGSSQPEWCVEVPGSGRAAALLLGGTAADALQLGRRGSGRGCDARVAVAGIRAHEAHVGRRGPDSGKGVAGRGLEGDPAHPREVHLDPGVGVGAAHAKRVAADQVADREPDRDAGGDPVEALEGGHGAGEVLTVADLRVEQERRVGRRVAGLRRGQRVDIVQAQILLDAQGDLVGVGRRAHDLSVELVEAAPLAVGARVAHGRPPLLRRIGAGHVGCGGEGQREVGCDVGRVTRARERRDRRA